MSADDGIALGIAPSMIQLLVFLLRQPTSTQVPILFLNQPFIRRPQPRDGFCLLVKPREEKTQYLARFHYQVF